MEPTQQDVRKVYVRTPRGCRLAATISVTEDTPFVIAGADVSTGEARAFRKAGVVRTTAVFA